MRATHSGMGLGQTGAGADLAQYGALAVSGTDTPIPPSVLNPAIEASVNYPAPPPGYVDPTTTSTNTILWIAGGVVLFVLLARRR